MAYTSYIDFVRDNRRFLAFGVLMSFSSSFGQTFFIGVFGPEFRDAFGLSHSQWGSIYLLGTLASAALLPFAGRLIDHIDLRVYVGVVGAALAIACLFAASAVGPVSLVLAILALRLSGQGLSSHIAQTAMARYYDTQRGRALASTTLGLAAGEALLPVLAVALIGVVGWRAAYAGAGVAHGLLILPVLLWLLRGHAGRHEAYLSRQTAGHPGAASRGPSRGWTRAEVLRDATFYQLLPCIVAQSLVLTAMFFHHLTVAEAKG